MEQETAKKLLNYDLRYQKPSSYRLKERLYDTSKNATTLFEDRPQNEPLICDQHQQVTTKFLTNNTKATTTRAHQNSNTLLNNLIHSLFNLLILNTVLSHLNYVIKTSTLDNNFQLDTWKFILPNIISARKS